MTTPPARPAPRASTWPVLTLPAGALLAACGAAPAPGGAVDRAPTRAAVALADTPEEFGDVAWGRDLDAALERAARTERPVLLLFQEVPG